MSIEALKQLETLSRERRELYRLREEASAEMGAIADRIKSSMGDCEQVIAGEYKITHKTVESTGIDITALKQTLPDIAARLVKQTVTKRFTIA